MSRWAFAVWFAVGLCEFAAFGAAAAGPNLDPDFLFLDNGKVRVGVKRSSGAGIAWLSESGATRNVINHWDRGRLIQQSYYGAADGSMWNKTPWRWNPVQGGDWRGQPATVLELRSTRTSLYAKSRARHWASGAEMDDVIFEEWIRLKDRLALVHFRMTYTGSQSHPAIDHEIPALFFSPELDTLVAYDGGAPWTRGSLSRSTPGWPNEYRAMAENWAAYVDSTGFGAGAYVSRATRLTCYRYGDGREDHGSCSYFAPLVRFAITPGIQFDYEVVLTLGTVEAIRSRYEAVHRESRRSVSSEVRINPR